MSDSVPTVVPGINLLVACVHFNTVERVQTERALEVLARTLSDRPTDLLLYCNNAQVELHTIREKLGALYENGERCFHMRVEPFQRVPAKTHPYTVNEVMKFAEAHEYPYVLFTRTDYLLVPWAVDTLVGHYNEIATAEGPDPFVSGWIYQTAYDREQRDLPEPDYEAVPWWTSYSGVRAMVDVIPGYKFHETDLDAGVWLTSVKNWRTIAQLNEEMTSWGYAQSTWQRQLKVAGVPFSVIQDYVAIHQWHGIWERDHTKARQEYDQFGGGV